MLVSTIPFAAVLLAALVVTAVYKFRYGHMWKNPWTVVVVFVLNLMFFGWAILIFVALEWFRWHKKSGE